MTVRIKIAAALILLGFTLGCAQFGIGMDVKPEGAQERFLAVLVDYRIAMDEAAIAVEGFADAVEQGDPNTALYLSVAEAVDRLRARARKTIELAGIAIASQPDPSSDLEAYIQVINTIIADVQRELLRASALEA